MRNLPGKTSACWIALALAWSLGAAALAAEPGPARPARPNVLYIMTDQQHAGMLSCAGNRFLKTPALDSLAAQGARFERAYASNPVCLPSRTSMMTGQYPGRFGIGENHDGGRSVPEETLRTSLGWLFRNAGYETVFGGKTHWAQNMTPESIGFRELTHSRRGVLESSCAEFLAEKHERPFFLVASFINPHDICYMGIDESRAHSEKAAKKGEKRGSQGGKRGEAAGERHPELAKALRLPPDVSEATFYEQFCPPLPANFEVPALEPQAVQSHYVEAKSFRDYMRRNWDEQHWRRYRWAYARLTESVDAQIGVILQALRQAGLEEQTLVVFSSDHGDMDAAHRLGHKSVLYEEAARVPFLVSYRGVTRPGLVDTEHLVSSGVDLLPTLCDYAGISVPAGLPGRSVRALAEGRPAAGWRDELVVESCSGRMLRTERFKYVVYEDGQHREQLTDLAADPGEMQNLAEDPQYQGPLAEHRARLRQWVEQSGDGIGRAWLVP